MPKQFILKNENDTKEIAEKLGDILQKGDCITLTGDLGAGKTAFSRFLIRSLSDNKEQEVPSPTFTLVQLYDLPKFTIWHFDLYRIKNTEEIYELDWEDACYDGVTMIEWPDRLKHLTPKERIEIKISFAENNDRMLEIKGIGEVKERLNDL